MHVAGFLTVAGVHSVAVDVSSAPDAAYVNIVSVTTALVCMVPIVPPQEMPLSTSTVYCTYTKRVYCLVYTFFSLFWSLK